VPSGPAPSAAALEAVDGGGALANLDGDVPVDLPPEVVAKIEATATEFVRSLAATPLGSRAWERSIRAVDGLGAREVDATTQIAARFQDRPVRAVEEVLADRAPLTRHLRELREAAAGLIRRVSSGRGDPDDLTRAVEEAEDRVSGLVAALDDDRAILEVDNAAIDQQERALWIEIETLRRYTVLAARLDDLVGRRVEELRDVDLRAAHALEVEALHAIRRRRRDLLLQLAVATQGYAALRIVEQDNLELIWAIRAATATTASAVRTALFAARATGDRSNEGDVAAVVNEFRGTLQDMQDALDEAERRRRTALAEARGRSG
jgi:uncharacterized protein YaaN involved in tellurite resistance